MHYVNIPSWNGLGFKGGCAVSPRNTAIDAIVQALAFLKGEHEKYGRWEDPANKASDTTGEIMECEAYLCFLLPLNQFSSQPDVQNQIFDVYPEANLKKDVYDLISGLSGAFSGTPYVSIQDSDGQSHPFLDTVCYVISIITFAEKVLGEPEAQPQQVAIQQVMEKCLRFLREATVVDREGRAKGWSFTNHDVPDRPFKYSTWMATDSLSDLTSIPDLNKKYYCSKEAFQLATILRRALPQVAYEQSRLYVDGKHTEDERQAFNGRNVLITSGKPVLEDEDDVGFNYNLWIIMALLYLNYDDPSVLANALGSLAAVIDKPDPRRRLLT